MTDREIVIPPKFWATLTPLEFSNVFIDDGLNAELCVRLWHMMDRQDAPPRHLKVWIKKAELERMLKKIKPKRRKS
jgi:hypothetical protein